MPEVSVILPSYNHEKYIAESIQSVLDQEFQDFELIIIDDGSQDGTAMVAEGFADPRIKLIKFKQNQGLSIALNCGIAKSAGKYLAILHSDDMFMPQKLGKQVRFLDSNPDISAVFCHAQIIDENGNEFVDQDHYYYSIFEQPNRPRYQWLNHFFYQGNCLCHPSVLIRRTCFETAGLYDERLALLEDFDFWIKICLFSDIYILPEKLVKFRVRDYELNSSGQRPETQIRCAVEIMQVLRQFTRIPDKADLFQVFPQTNRKGEVPDSVAVPFIIAMLALERGSPGYQTFALHLLYELLENRESAQILATEFDFGVKELIAMAGQYDVFSLVSDSFSQVYFDYGDGFSKEKSRLIRINKASPKFHVDIPVENADKVKAICWDLEKSRYCKVKVSQAFFQNRKEEKKCLQAGNMLTNGSIAEDNFYVFNMQDPVFIFNINEDITGLTIQGEWEFGSVDALEEEIRIRDYKLQTLEEKSRALIDLNQSQQAEICKRDYRLETLEVELRAIEDLNQSQQEEIRKRDYKLETSEAELRTIKDTNQVLKAEIRALDELKNNREADIYALLNSRSWKLTAPLRWLSKAIVSNHNPGFKRKG